MSAFGRVRIGFSLPWVAEYVNTSGTVSYTGGMRLARGVDVNLSPETSEDNNFYCDNGIGESESGKFTGGTLSLTCDDPLPAAKALVQGTSEADTSGWVHYGDEDVRPYVGIGWIVTYMSDGVKTYVPTVVRKCRLTSMGDEASTKEDEISYQTTSQEYELFRDDTTNHDWKWVHEAGFSTEADAEAALKTALGVTITT